MEAETSNNAKDAIHKLFLRVFVNDSQSCTSQVEKPYYSAGIYPDIYIECESLNVSKLVKGEYPRCSGCGNNTTISKKRLMWKHRGKDKKKHRKINFSLLCMLNARQHMNNKI